MFTAILNVQNDEVDLFSPSANIYVPLSLKMVDDAEKWLAAFPFMQKSCEIMYYRGIKILHVKPSDGKHLGYNGMFWLSNGGANIALQYCGKDLWETYKYTLKINFGVLENPMIKSSAAYGFLAILDGEFANFSSFDDINKAQSDIHIDAAPVESRPYIDENRMYEVNLSFNPAQFQLHITEDLPKLFDECFSRPNKVALRYLGCVSGEDGAAPGGDEGLDVDHLS